MNTVESPQSFFFNLGKTRGNQNQIRKLITDEKEIDGDVEILKKSIVSMKHFSKVRLSKMYVKLKNFYGITTVLLRHLSKTIKLIFAKKSYLKLLYTMQ